jgi:hypothetical protein
MPQALCLVHALWPLASSANRLHGAPRPRLQCRVQVALQLPVGSTVGSSGLPNVLQGVGARVTGEGADWPVRLDEARAPAGVRAVFVS